MKIINKILMAFAFVVALVGTPAAASDDDVWRLVLQVSDNDPGTFTKVLNNASNFSAAMLEAGNEYEIEIVAWNAGLHLFRADTSTEAERVAAFSSSIPNLTFSACGNTIQNMSKKEGIEIQLIEGVRVVPGGILRATELVRDDWVLIRP
ncbi:MAG TPA: hypothetical protein VLA27_07405 [Paracoccaceae bacterium]|nr:hypothetical protein [Paracoccaceae bacterium]